jgi:diguanylate cyclase (GGDEF)-like protein/PAS domain S-box-containing protein
MTTELRKLSLVSRLYRLNAMVAKLDRTVVKAQEERSKTEALIAAIGEGVAIFDVEKRFVYQNPIHIDLVGRHVGEACFNAYHDDKHACGQCAVSRTLSDGQIHKMERQVIVSGRGVYLDVTTSPVRDMTGKIVSVIEIARDVTDRKLAEERAQHLAFHDPLTGLANRALLEDRLILSLAHALRGNEEGALFFIDLDRFKAINDSLGHHAGDLLLKGVAKRLQSLVRTTDTVCRSGGDEFILLFPEIGGPTDAAHLAEKILVSFTAPFIVEEREIIISPSIGISLYPGDGADFVTLIRSADAAMYLAKRQGRNNFQFFTPELTDAAQDRLLLGNSLRQALAQNELLLHYQPQFDAATGEIIGVEALSLWYYPPRGWISPAQFIPIAEESGLIEELGAWVLRTACAQNKQWQEHGYTPMRMAVNVSGRQFRQRDFVNVVDRILEETGLDPCWLEVEVTEKILMENVREAILVLTELKTRHISLAIDDFGSGYSSLGYLRQFPADRLKIDRSFVANITSNAGDAAIASAVISLAKSLNFEVIAEGVETVEQMKLLQEKKCDVMQGYHISRPVPPEEIQALLERIRSNPGKGPEIVMGN